MQPGGRCILFDPQYSTKNGLAAPWDHGEYAIQEFIRNHVCSKLCRQLSLPPLVPTRPKPVALAPHVDLDDDTDRLAFEAQAGIIKPHDGSEGDSPLFIEDSESNPSHGHD